MPNPTLPYYLEESLRITVGGKSEFYFMNYRSSKFCITYPSGFEGGAQAEKFIDGLDNGGKNTIRLDEYAENDQKKVETGIYKHVDLRRVDVINTLLSALKAVGTDVGTVVPQ